jgi:hypothetical protein
MVDQTATNSNTETSCAFSSDNNNIAAVTADSDDDTFSAGVTRDGDDAKVCGTASIQETKPENKSATQRRMSDKSAALHVEGIYCCYNCTTCDPPCRELLGGKLKPFLLMVPKESATTPATTATSAQCTNTNRGSSLTSSCIQSAINPNACTSTDSTANTAVTGTNISTDTVSCSGCSSRGLSPDMRQVLQSRLFIGRVACLCWDGSNDAKFVHSRNNRTYVNDSQLLSGSGGDGGVYVQLQSLRVRLYTALFFPVDTAKRIANWSLPLGAYFLEGCPSHSNLTSTSTSPTSYYDWKENSSAQLAAEPRGTDGDLPLCTNTHSRFLALLLLSP